MSELGRQDRIGNNIVSRKKKEPILEGCAHVYLGDKVAIGLSRCFFDDIKELGVGRWKRTSKQTYDHPDLPTHASTLDSILTVSIYTESYDSGNSNLHNFMVVGIPKHVQDILRERFPAMARIKAVRTLLIPPRRPRVVHIDFNMEGAEIIGMVQPDLREVFR